MSITKLIPSEKIYFKKSKEYRKAMKSRLKELAEDGDDEARGALEYYFPKIEFDFSKNEEAETYIKRVLGRKRETIPYMLCLTCGKKSDRVKEYQDTDLRNEKRKTWRRIIKPNLNLPLVSVYNKKLRIRRIFLSYPHIECLKKKHKLTIRYTNKTIKSMGYAYK